LSGESDSLSFAVVTAIQIAHPEKQSLFFSLPSVKAVWRNHYGATQKQIRPPIFHQRAET
jgi:hypothetical protein